MKILIDWKNKRIVLVRQFNFHRLDRHIEELTQHLTKNPDDAHIRFMLGNSLSAKGMVSQATEEWKKVTEADNADVANAAREMLNQVDSGQ